MVVGVVEVGTVVVVVEVEVKGVVEVDRVVLSRD